MQTFTWSDVRALQALGKLVFVLESSVYVLEDKFSHPGGSQALLSSSGQDISGLFRGQGGGHAHSAAARRLLQTYCAGRLADGEQEEQDRAGLAGPEASTIIAPCSSQDFSIDESKPLLQQVGHLGAAYDTWVHTPVAGQPRFFRSSLAESLTKVQWWVVPLLWLPVAGYCLWRAARLGGLPVLAVAALAMCGVVAWQLLEYSIHRWLFHLKPSSYVGIYLHFLLHGCHHKYPTDVERLVFPPMPASWAAALIFTGVRALLPQAYAEALFGGILLGYVAYDTMHYLMHSGQLGGSLKASHMHHHYVNDNEGFGISSPLFDVVFCTRRKAH